MNSVRDRIEKDGGFYIPVEALVEKGFTPTDKTVYGILKVFFPSQKAFYVDSKFKAEIAQFIHCATATVNNSLYRMRRLGYLRSTDGVKFKFLILTPEKKQNIKNHIALIDSLRSHYEN